MEAGSDTQTSLLRRQGSRLGHSTAAVWLASVDTQTAIDRHLETGHFLTLSAETLIATRSLVFLGRHGGLDPSKQQILALGRLGWPLRRIEQETGIRRETVAVRRRGRPGEESPKPAIPLRRCPPTPRASGRRPAAPRAPAPASPPAI